jgi:hypothetical protein
MARPRKIRYEVTGAEFVSVTAGALHAAAEKAYSRGAYNFASKAYRLAGQAYASAPKVAVRAESCYRMAEVAEAKAENRVLS